MVAQDRINAWQEKAVKFVYDSAPESGAPAHLTATTHILVPYYLVRRLPSTIVCFRIQ